MILYFNYKKNKKTVLLINFCSKCMQTLFNNLWLFKLYFYKGKKNKKKFEKKRKKKL